MPAIAHRGFTIVEALVAATLITLAAAFYARTAVATTRARTRAAQLRAAAARIRAREAYAERLRCAGADTSGVEPGDAIIDHWRVATDVPGVAWRDSVVVAGRPLVVASGHATCAE